MFTVLAIPLFAAASVDALVMETLRAAYPAVTRWEIRPFGEPPADGVASAAKVVRLGSRTAVRVNHKTYWYAVAGFRTVVSATAWTSAGEALDAQSGALQERDVVAPACDPLTDVSTLRGMRAKRALHPNDVICAQHVEPRPAVARGEVVTVRYVGTRVSLTTKAIAQSDGAVGDRLLLRVARGADSFPALVSGAGEVTIHE
jgi:flagella basal body P-ring formation protein FlgA